MRELRSSTITRNGICGIDQLSEVQRSVVCGGDEHWPALKDLDHIAHVSRSLEDDFGRLRPVLWVSVLALLCDHLRARLLAARRWKVIIDNEARDVRRRLAVAVRSQGHPANFIRYRETWWFSFKY